jgi:hypothetical protein
MKEIKVLSIKNQIILTNSIHNDNVMLNSIKNQYILDA